MALASGIEGTEQTEDAWMRWASTHNLRLEEIKLDGIEVEGSNIYPTRCCPSDLTGEYSAGALEVNLVNVGTGFMSSKCL